ncbi:energy transducer TonB [Parasedimentitalea huanghaiensis]|uniref:TonB family protein n=1 Tax=Parasedimentitalea huanghaiensis TaxID=2682100 RepID=A0A6L6WCU1_9RHOB|nr:TonB family protein [Zongyanglinia huanghaiensis]MVO14699.1 TonB family protein [Zongyanglinia huanghaiensis]
MTPQSRSVALFALILAAAAHAAPAFLKGNTDVQIEGGNTALASQGNSFTNMAAGVQEPEKPQDITNAQDTIERPQTPPITPPIKPLAENQVAQAIEPSRALPRQQIVKPVEQLSKVEPVQASAVTPQVQNPIAVDTAPALQAVPQDDSARRTDPEVVRPIQQSEQGAAKPSERAPLTPKPEIQSPIAEAKPQPKPKPKPRGNGANTTAQGTADGQSNSPGGQARTNPSTSKVQGNAAASNYSGTVRRKIHRAKRQRVNIKGVALVSFNIAPNGSISGARVARSSGSAKLDRIALSQVRRASPFPPPPPGARTSYSVEIKGK